MPRNVAGQAVGVLRDQLNSIGAVGLVDANRARGADAVAVQEQHDLANHLLLGPAPDNAFGALRTDPGHLAQAPRLLLDDVEHGFAKGAHEFLGIDGADATDHAGAEVFLGPFDRGWRRRLEKRGSELDAVGAVVDPASARLDELAGRDHRGVADDGDQVALTTGLHLQNAEPGLVVVEGDALDETGQNLNRGARPRCSVGKTGVSSRWLHKTGGERVLVSAKWVSQWASRSTSADAPGCRSAPPRAFHARQPG